MFVLEKKAHSKTIANIFSGLSLIDNQRKLSEYGFNGKNVFVPPRKKSVREMGDESD